MTHWIHAETPFGNIVYQTSSRDDGAPTIVMHGVGTLTAEDALTASHQGDTVPNWDATKAEARRIAEEAGAPLARWYTPDPPLTVNGKSYTESVWAEFRTDANDEPYVFFRMGGLTAAAQRKVASWLLENREALTGGENGRASAIAAARDTLRWAERNLSEAREAARLREQERDTAAAKLATLEGEARP